MRLGRTALFAASGALLLLSFPAFAPAQQRGTMTLFSQPGFTGTRYVMNGSRRSIQLGWTVRSILASPRDRWEICAATLYRGHCTTVSGRVANMRRLVGSARRVPPVTLKAPLPPPAGTAGASLRGTAAEFFAAPGVRSCAPAACAAQRADRYCRSRGWAGAAFQGQQTIRGRLYLVDILCTRTGS